MLEKGVRGVCGCVCGESNIGNLDVFIDEVVPLLQQRGLFRTAYEGETLRAHFGLDQPESKFW